MKSLKNRLIKLEYIRGDNLAMIFVSRTPDEEKANLQKIAELEITNPYKPIIHFKVSFTGNLDKALS